MQPIGEADPFEDLRADAVGDSVDDLGAIVRGIDMNPERTRTVRHADHRDDGIRHAVRVGVCGSEPGEPAPRNAVDARMGPDS
jgi:hypothetical protein